MISILLLHFSVISSIAVAIAVGAMFAIFVPRSEFWRSVFSESDRSGSFSRVSSAVIVALELWIMAYCTIKRFPFPFSLEEAAVFAASPYGVNKLVAMVQAARGSASPPTQ